MIVETARGVECGEVAMVNRRVEEASLPQPLKKIIRAATKEDLARLAENAAKEKHAFQVCCRKIEACLLYTSHLASLLGVKLGRAGMSGGKKKHSRMCTYRWFQPYSRAFHPSGGLFTLGF